MQFLLKMLISESLMLKYKNEIAENV